MNIQTNNRTGAFIENLLCFLFGVVFAIAMMAILMGDGNKGLLDLFF